MSIYKTHVCLEVNSRRRTRGTIEDMQLELSHQITFSQKPSKSYWLRFENVQMPLSFYQVDADFNTFQWIETGGSAATLTIIIPVGNYTITELLVELEGLADAKSFGLGNIDTFTFTYDDKTNKISLRYDSGPGGDSTAITIDTIANGSTINSMLGLGKADTNTITGGDVTLVLADGVASVAPNCVDLHRCAYVDIETSLTSNTHYDEDQQKHIGVRVPMLVDRNEVQYFGNHTGALSKLNNKGPIGNLGFRLLNEEGNLKNLCQVDWSGDMCIYELTEVHKAQHSTSIPDTSPLPNTKPFQPSQRLPLPKFFSVADPGNITGVAGLIARNIGQSVGQSVQQSVQQSVDFSAASRPFTTAAREIGR